MGAETPVFNLFAFSFVSKETCDAAQSEIERSGELKSVPGVIPVLAVAAISRGKVTASSASPMADSIQNLQPCWWKQHILKECPEEEEVNPVTGAWVAALYDDKWYVGKVLAVYLTDTDAHIYHSCKTPQSNLVS